MLNSKQDAGRTEALRTSSARFELLKRPYPITGAGRNWAFPTGCLARALGRLQQLAQCKPCNMRKDCSANAD
jgi:hypothetical protein